MQYTDSVGTLQTVSKITDQDVANLFLQPKKSSPPWTINAEIDVRIFLERKQR